MAKKILLCINLDVPLRSCRSHPKKKKIKKRAIPLLFGIVYTYLYNKIHKYTNVATNTYIMKKNGEECQCHVKCCNGRQAWGIYHPPTFPTCLPCGNMCRCKKEKNLLK